MVCCQKTVSCWKILVELSAAQQPWCSGRYLAQSSLPSPDGAALRDCMKGLDELKRSVFQYAIARILLQQLPITRRRLLLHGCCLTDLRL
jgi:hypothetical protein